MSRSDKAEYPTEELRETLLDMECLRNIVANCNILAVIKEAKKAYSQLRFTEENGFDPDMLADLISHGNVVLRKAMEMYDPDRSGTFSPLISSVSAKDNGIEIRFQK